MYSYLISLSKFYCIEISIETIGTMKETPRRRITVTSYFIQCAQIFKLLRTPGIDSTEFISCENHFLRGIDSRDGGRELGPENEVNSSFENKHFMGYGRLDSIHSSFSIPEIDFSSLTCPKIPAQYGHKVLIYIEHHSVCPLIRIGTPPPL